MGQMGRRTYPAYFYLHYTPRARVETIPFFLVISKSKVKMDSLQLVKKIINRE